MEWMLVFYTALTIATWSTYTWLWFCFGNKFLVVLETIGRQLTADLVHLSKLHFFPCCNACLGGCWGRGGGGWWWWWGWSCWPSPSPPRPPCSSLTCHPRGGGSSILRTASPPPRTHPPTHQHHTALTHILPPKGSSLLDSPLATSWLASQPQAPPSLSTSYWSRRPPRPGTGLPPASVDVRQQVGIDLGCCLFAPLSAEPPH